MRDAYIHREEEVIRNLSNAYQLTNSQRYTPATQTDGVLLRKYARVYEDGTDVSVIPPDFPFTNMRLTIGPNRPGPRAKVCGKWIADYIRGGFYKKNQFISISDNDGRSGNNG